MDLGLPSGLKWANANVGATSITDGGLYFAWGETVGYTADSGHNFDDAHYTASSISSDLDLAHDAAHVNMGGSWRMPTRAEILELCKSCFAEWTESYNGSGVAGLIFYSCATNTTGKGYFFGGTEWRKLNPDKKYPIYQYYNIVSQPVGFVAYTFATPHIFLPAAGQLSYTNFEKWCTAGYYFLSEYYAEEDEAGIFEFFSDAPYTNSSSNRVLGFNVRGVCE